MKLEIHAGNGGTDAELFAHELGSAIASYAGTDMVYEGRVLTLDRL